jgi:hypothetical protein
LIDFAEVLILEAGFSDYSIATRDNRASQRVGLVKTIYKEVHQVGFNTKRPGRRSHFSFTALPSCLSLNLNVRKRICAISPRISGFWSAAIVMALFGCGPSEEESRFRHLEEQAKRQYTPSEIRTAVEPLFVKYAFYTSNRWNPPEIASNDIPGEIRSLSLFSDHPETLSGWRCSSDALMFQTGGGFGHWGVVVYSDTNHVVHDRRYDRWGEGVYFFRE